MKMNKYRAVGIAFLTAIVFSGAAIAARHHYQVIGEGYGHDRDQAYEAAQKHVTDVTAEIEPAKEAVQEAKAKFDECKEQLLSLQADERKAGSDVILKKKQVVKNETDIEQHRQRQAEADNGLYAEKVHELEEAKAEYERVKEAFQSHDTGLSPLQDQVRSAHREKLAADQGVATARDDERRIRSNINGLRGGQRNWIEAYPQPVVLDKLIRAVASDRRFREKPVGPMGRHVKLLRPEWGYILEKQFGSVLNGFVVTSKADQNTLSELMRKFNW